MNCATCSDSPAGGALAHVLRALYFLTCPTSALKLLCSTPLTLRRSQKRQHRPHPRNPARRPGWLPTRSPAPAAPPPSPRSWRSVPSSGASPSVGSATADAAAAASGSSTSCLLFSGTLAQRFALATLSSSIGFLRELARAAHGPVSSPHFELRTSERMLEAVLPSADGRGITRPADERYL